MSHDDLIIHHRVQLFKYAKRYNVKAACHIFGISRTRYYELLSEYLKYGREGLRPKIKPHPVMPNQTKKEVEEEILEYVRKYPTQGPLRISNELRRRTNGRIHYSPAGIYKVLKRRRLNLKLDRLLLAEREGGGIFTDLLVRELRKQQEKHIETTYAGELLSVDVKLVGRIRGIGRIYHQVGVDCDSSFGFAKLYTRKGAETGVDLLERRILPIFSSLGIPLHRVLTDNGREYTSSTERGKRIHLFESALRRAGVRHTMTKARHPWTNGYAESFHKTLMNDFYHLAFRRKLYSTLDELQHDLDQFLLKYNFERTHTGYKLNGMTPAEKFLNGRRCLALESPKIQLSKNGETECVKVST